MTPPPAVRDVVILLVRIAIGAVFVAHGWQKLMTFGVSGTSAAFREVGVPAPTLSAWFAAVVETAAGLALVIGLAVPVAGLLLFLDMLGAFVFVHAEHGLFVTQGGYELVLALGAASLLLAAVGAGRYSLDGWWTSRRARRLTTA